jgi:hypothetical protein
VRFLNKRLAEACLSHQSQLNLSLKFASADSKMCARKLLTKTQVWTDGGKEVQKRFYFNAIAASDKILQINE